MADPFVAEIRIFPFNFAPKGWAWCNGQLMPLSQNTALFSLLGTTYGGNGKSNFALPDLEGRAPMHPGQGPGLSLHDLGETGGSETVTLLESEIPSHSHGMRASGDVADTNAPTGGSAMVSKPAGRGNNLFNTANAGLAMMNAVALTPAGGDQPHNNLQPYLTFYFNIALQGVFPRAVRFYVHTSAEYFRSEVPAGSSGAWVIEKFTVPAREYDSAADPRPDCFKFRPGVYTCLRREGTQFMTDLYDEWWTQRDGIAEARARGGEVLVTGLGLGLIAEAMLRPAESRVSRVTIVEFSPDVIRLVAPYLRARYPERVEIVEADARAWEPPEGRRFTVGWHDIWPDPYGPEVAAEVARLEERYRPFCDWQGSWPATYLAAVAGR